jgi:NAD+ diphosphatase
MDFASDFKTSAEEFKKGYWFLFCNDELLLKKAEDGLAIPLWSDIENSGAKPDDMQYIGLLEDQPCFVGILTQQVVPEGFSRKKVRQLYGHIPDEHFMFASRAYHILTWLKHNRFCGCCGGTMKVSSLELALKCTQCGSICYPRISPAIIVAVVKDHQLLLAHSNRLPAGRYSVIAGFVEPGETLEDCVKRELKEEVGVEVRHIEYFGSQPWPFPDSLMVAFTAQWSAGKITVDNDEVAEAHWFSAHDLPANIPDKVSIARQLIDWFIKKNKSAVSS